MAIWLYGYMVIWLYCCIVVLLYCRCDAPEALLPHRFDLYSAPFKSPHGLFKGLNSRFFYPRVVTKRQSRVIFVEK